MRGSIPRRVLILVAIAAVLRAFMPPSQSSERRRQPTEFEVKAAYLLNFTKFIEWPSADEDEPFVICIAGHDPFGAVIDQVMEGETVSGRNIVVRRLEDQATTSCQIVYGGKSVPGPAQPGVLTVGEGEQFVRSGGMIGFVVENRRVRFDINQRAAHRAGITLSSKLLSVARTVEK